MFRFHSQGSTSARRTAPRRWIVSVLGSVSVHLAILIAVTFNRSHALDFSIELNTDLDFGQAVPVEPIMPGATPTAAPVPPATQPPSQAASEAPDDSAWAAPRPDAGPPPVDAAPPPDAAPKPKPKHRKPKPDAALAPDTAPPPVDAGVPPSAPVSTPPDAGPPPSAPPSLVAAAASSASSLADAGAPRSPEAGATAAASSPPGLAAQAPSGAVALPAGAQIALRMDLALIRQSPLAEDVRGLLAAIPDWQRLLLGSGVDPVTALDRVLIATPTIRQDRMVLAGALAQPDTSIVRQAVRSLAEARGENAAWSEFQGHPLAQWVNADDVVRHIVLLSDRHFIIGRIDDLPPVMALAQARAAEAQAAPGFAPASTPAPPSGSPSGPDTPSGAPSAPAVASQAMLSGPDSLLWMAPSTVLSAEVEGARRLVRGATPLVPERLRLALVALDGARVAVELAVDYPTAAEASDALEALERERRAALGDPLTLVAMQMMGLGPTVSGAAIEIREEKQVFARSEVTYAQLRGLMTYIRTWLDARPPVPTHPAPAPRSSTTPSPRRPPPSVPHRPAAWGPPQTPGPRSTP